MDRIELYFSMASNIYSVCITLIASYCYMVWIRPFLERRRTAWLCFVVYVAVMEILIHIPFNMTATVAYGIAAMTVFFVMCLAERGDTGRKFYLAVTFFCIRWQSLCIEICVSNELYLLMSKWMISANIQSEQDLLWLGAYIIESIIDLLLAVLLMYGAVRLLLWAYGTKREHLKRRELLILLVPSVSGVFAYEMIQYYTRIYERDSGKYVLDIYGYYDWLLLLYSLVCFATIFVMTYVFCQWKKEQAEDRQREIFSRQMQDMERHIEEVERLYRDMRSLRHDMGNHLMTLEQLYERKEYGAAEQYTEAIKCEMQKPSMGVGSGNPVTDVILSDRKKEMEEKGIDFINHFHYPSGGEVNAFDLSIILNNGLSNAIEAVERENTSASAHISLSSYREKNMYIIEMVNSYGGELKTDIRNGLPVTSKSGEGHGFGLASIRHAARKYLGDIEIGKEIIGDEACCVLRVMLQLTGV